MWLRCVKDPSRKLWIGNIPEQAKWKDLQALVDEAALGFGNVLHGSYTGWMSRAPILDVS